LVNLIIRWLPLIVVYDVLGNLVTCARNNAGYATAQFKILQTATNVVTFGGLALLFVVFLVTSRDQVMKDFGKQVDYIYGIGYAFGGIVATIVITALLSLLVPLCHFTLA
jgi:uncharacterized membrane protein